MGTGPGVAGPVVRRMVAPAKLTLSLRVLGRRPDGFHELEAEMVSLDLADELEITPGGRGLVIEAVAGARAAGLSTGPDNLVRRALAAVGREAGVRLTKRIPVQGGLGGGSTDAAAVLRWAGGADPAGAAALGADVPFCLAGGRAVVTGLGERVAPLPHQDRAFVLVIPPFGVDTAAAYRQWDMSQWDMDRPGGRGGGAHRVGPGARNDLQAAALAVAPDLARWGARLAELTGREPTLAGSGSTWFVEGTAAELGLAAVDRLSVDGASGLVLSARTVPAGWGEGSGTRSAEP